MNNRRRWFSTVVLACIVALTGIAVGFVPAARAEGASKDSSSAKSPDSGKKAAAKPKKRRKPVREGDTDENGVVYSK